VKEPEREEGGTLEARAHQSQDIPMEQSAVAPKAYAFDGWTMVPLEPEPV